MSSQQEIAANLASVRARVAAAALACGRDPASVRIVAVTKRLGPDSVRAAYAAGQRDFGENYVQEALEKIAVLAAEMPDARWHFVGRLQSNKAAAASRAFALLHGIDSLSTAAALSRAALKDGRRLDVLLQVRLGRRGANGDGATRGGIEAEDTAAFLAAAGEHKGLRFTGLMGVADPDMEARPQFAALRQLSAELTGLALQGAPLGELSMGMTADLDEAVSEGATIVRIGTAIFGQRPLA